MQFFIFVLLICFFIFLFCIHSLAKDDLILLRKDVSMERFFNIILLGSLICLFTARLFYGISHAKNILLNPFVFFLFPYFTGLSIVGGIIGAVIVFLYLFFRKKNQLPLGRMFDFCSIGLLITLPVGFLGYFMFSEERFSFVKAVSLMAVYAVLFSIFWRIFLPRILNGKFRDGTISILFLMCFSIINLTSNVIEDFKYMLTLENVILSCMLIAAIAGLIKQELLTKIVKR